MTALFLSRLFSQKSAEEEIALRIRARKFVKSLLREPVKDIDYEYETLQSQFMNCLSGGWSLYSHVLSLKVAYVARLEDPDEILGFLERYEEFLFPRPWRGPKVTGFIKDEDGRCGFSMAAEPHLDEGLFRMNLKFILAGLEYDARKAAAPSFVRQFSQEIRQAWVMLP